MNRRRWVYPLVAAVVAGAVLLADRILHPPVVQRTLPPVRYTGPLEMRPAPAPAPSPAPSPSPATRAPATDAGR